MSVEKYVSTRNACKLCTPLGAAMAFRGLKNTVSVLHGSQGCSTYIRRYMISHFKEPLDIASSNFSEDTAIFGGGGNLKQALRNVVLQYQPEIIGVATTCLSETIGDDVPGFIREFREEEHTDAALLTVSTPSYKGTHEDGFHAVIRAVAQQLAEAGDRGEHVNLLPGIVSPADIRYLKQILADFGLSAVICPDISDTLDGGMWDSYHAIPEGGTSLQALRSMGQACATLELGAVLARKESGGRDLKEKLDIPLHSLGLPIGITPTDHLFRILSELSGREMPPQYRAERARLIDAYADGHKYIFGKKVVLYGEQDFIAALAGFVDEIGMVPVLIASGGSTRVLKDTIAELIPDFADKPIRVEEEKDFVDIENLARDLEADLVIGNSKGYKLSRELNIPLVRVGFPIHDRLGGQRLLHLGYRGAQELFDRIVNSIMEKYQADNPWGYFYV